MCLLAVLSRPLRPGMVQVRGQNSRDLKIEHPRLFLHRESDNKENNFKLPTKSPQSKTFLLACLHYVGWCLHSLASQGWVAKRHQIELSCCGSGDKMPSYVLGWPWIWQLQCELKASYGPQHSDDDHYRPTKATTHLSCHGYHITNQGGRRNRAQAG